VTGVAGALVDMSVGCSECAFTVPASTLAVDPGSTPAWVSMGAESALVSGVSSQGWWSNRNVGWIGSWRSAPAFMQWREIGTYLGARTRLQLTWPRSAFARRRIEFLESLMRSRPWIAIHVVLAWLMAVGQACGVPQSQTISVVSRGEGRVELACWFQMAQKA
jgi:hypothetical protein